MDSKLINQKSQDLIANLYSWSSPDLHFGQPRVFIVLTRWSPFYNPVPLKYEATIPFRSHGGTNQGGKNTSFSPHGRPYATLHRLKLRPPFCSHGSKN